ncbi:MAG: choice-of-anchor A family protein [Gemmatimonas sp.]
MSRKVVASAALLLSAVAAPLSAQGLTGYNVFTFGSFMQTNTEVNGRVAVGGAFTNTNSSVGYSLPNGYSGNALVVAGSTTWNNGQVFHGNAIMAGARTLNGFGIPGGSVQPQATPVPVNFVTEKTRLDALSNSYSSMATNGVVAKSGNRMFFSGTSATTNVFTVSQADLAAANGEYNFYVPITSSIIVNVTGIGNGTFFGANSFNFCSGFINTTDFNNCSQGNNDNPPDLVSRLLWNVNTPNFASLSWNSSMRGSFLGTNVGVTVGYGSCIGDFAVASMNSNCEFYNRPYDGTTTITAVVPEPSTVALMFAGLAAVGFAARRRVSRKA